MQSNIVTANPTYLNVIPLTTQVVEEGNNKIVVMVFENKEKTQKNRIVTRYVEETQTTTILEQSTIPRETKPIFIEKNTGNGEVNLTSNNF